MMTLETGGEDVRSRNAHAAAGRREGLRDDIVDNLREKRELTNLADDEAIVLI